jgi:hypothetical protein
MGTLDALNGRYGAGAVPALGTREPWAMRQDAKTPAFTTKWA